MNESIASASSKRHSLPRIQLRGLGLRSSERLMLLGVVDVVLMIGALVVALHLRTTWLDTPGAFVAVWRWWVTLAVVWWIAAQLVEVYDLARAASAPHSIVAAVAAVAATVLIYQFIPVFTPPLGSRGLVVVFGALATVALAMWRGLYAVIFVQPAFQRRAIVLGAGAAGQALAEAVNPGREDAAPNPFRGTGYQVVGFVDDDPENLTTAAIMGAPMLGTSRDLLKLAREGAVDEVVLAITHRHTISQEAFDAFMACREDGFRVTTMEAVYERVLGRVPVNHIGRNISAVLPVQERGPLDRVYSLAKRVGDLLFTAIALIPLAAVMPLVALGNLLGNRGPLFYRQVRVGRGGRPFSVIKFRSMAPDAERECGAVWAKARDPRITPFGRFLRKVRLDELPQVLNVLHGEMSLIGPRPERPEFVEELARQIPFYKARHAVRPGLTGWAQVRFGYGNTVDDARIKLEYDLHYVRQAGFYLDALIMLKTAAVVLKLQGR